jgi:hypothetical protein
MVPVLRAVVRWRELEEEADNRPLLFSEGQSVLDRAVELVREQGARKNAKGGGVFTPQLAARLVHALLRDVHVYSGPEAARVRECCAQIVPLVLSDEGRGLRKLTAQELAWFALASTKLTPSDCPAVSEVPRQMEAECLRRGLDKFKAADLSKLLMALRTWRYKPGKDLAESVQERVMRRGYLTKGRGGQTPPLDVLRLLNSLLLSREELQLQPAVFDRFLEVMMLEGFVEPLASKDLTFAMLVVRRLHRLVSGQDSKVLAGRIMRQLVLRMEGGAGQEAYDPSVGERWLKLLSRLTIKELSPEVLAISGRLIERWAAAVEGGHHDISEPHPFFVQLDVCYRVGLLGVEGREHIANVLNEELTRLLRADGLSSIDPSNGRFLLEVLRLWRGLGYYPGDDLMDMLLDRILSMGGMRHSVWADFLGSVVQHAERLHGYKPKAGFADRMLEILSLAPLKNVADVHQMCSSIEMLCTSSSIRHAQQPVVKGFIRHIGDPEALVERVYGGSNPASLTKLNGALDHLKTVASGGDVAK